MLFRSDYGFRAIISSRFADIFRNNCLKIGLIPVTLGQETVERIMAAVEDDPTIEIVVDVPDLEVRVPSIDLEEPFFLDDHHVHRLVNGLDDIGITEQYADDITAFEATRPDFLPRVGA